MISARVHIPTKPFELTDLFDTDRDTGIWLEKTADDDTIRFDLGGASPVTDALTMTSSAGLVWNNGGSSALDVRFAGDTLANLFFVDASADSIGINVAAPGKTFDIAGTLRVLKNDDSTHVIFGRTGPDPVATFSSTIPTNSITEALKLEPAGGFWAGTTSAGQGVIGLSVSSQHNTGTHSQPHHGINVSVRTGGTVTKSGTGNNRMAGLVFNVLHNATGTCDEMGGLVGQVGVGAVSSSVNVGAITTAFGLRGGIITQTSGTSAVTSAYTIWAVAPTGTGVNNTITNQYGLLVENQRATGITNAWAIKTGTGKVEFDDEVWCDHTVHFSRLSVSSTRNTDNAHVIYGVQSTGGAYTLTIDSDDIAEAGNIIIVKDEDGNASVNNITIATEGGQTIDGAPSDTIADDYGWRAYYSDGSNLFIIG